MPWVETEAETFWKSISRQTWRSFATIYYKNNPTEIAAATNEPCVR